MTLSVSTQIAAEDDLQTFSRMLQSVNFADEILIFNLEADPNELRSLAKQFNATIINVKKPTIVETIRSEQITKAHGDWVLIIDYDEVATPTLCEEIQTIMGSSGACSAYAIPRDNYSLGYPLRHGGWERDCVVRLLRHHDFVTWPTNIHSTPVVRGCTLTTNHVLEHHKDSSIAQMIVKTNRYSAIEAELFFAGGLPPVSPLTLLRKPTMEFIRRYFLKRGFLDGSIGLIQSLYQAYSVFISYAKLYELQQKKI